jgi:hypothetical protein
MALRTTDLKGRDVAGECDAGSPAQTELRPTCAGTPRVNLSIVVSGELWAKVSCPSDRRNTFTFPGYYFTEMSKFWALRAGYTAPNT